MSKPAIYAQHDAAFALVSAFVVLKDNEAVARIAFKFPRDGAGRLYAYVHFLGMPMVRGFAGGYGYDKKTAAIEDAAKRIDPAYFDQPDNAWANSKAQCEAFVAAINESPDGRDWDTSLRAAGYNVLQAV